MSKEKRILSGEIIEFCIVNYPEGPEELAVAEVGTQTWEIPISMFTKAGHAALVVGTRFDVVTPTANGNWPRSISKVLAPKLGPTEPITGV